MPDDALLGGRYRRISLVGAGGMGEVWLGEDTVLQRRVAIKAVLARTLADPEARARLLGEARLAARLDHPHAVTVHDVVESDGVPHLIMQFVDGRTLGDLGKNGPGEPRAIAGLLTGVADALAHAHGLGIVHRDIKPSNVLVDIRGRALLADFGIARAMSEARLTVTGDFLGTPGYLAPEVAQGEDASPASDVYALGVTLWVAVEGRTPYDDGNADPVVLLSRALTRPVPRPTRAGPLADLLVAMLAGDPGARPTAAQTAAALASIAAGHGLPVPHPVDAPTRTIDRPRLPDHDAGTTRRGPSDGDPLDSLLGAIEHTDRRTRGWSGPLAEWESLVVEVLEPMLGPDDRADLFVPALFRLDPRTAGSWPRPVVRSLAAVRAGVVVTLADRLLCAWTKSARTLAGAGVTIAYADVTDIAAHSVDDEGVPRTGVVLAGVGWTWPVVLVERPDLRPLAELMLGRIRGAVRPQWRDGEVANWTVDDPAGARTIPGWGS